MQDQKTAGQAEDWELSEAYYKEDTGKKELRLEDFLEEETAEGQSGLADGVHSRNNQHFIVHDADLSILVLVF